MNTLLKLMGYLILAATLLVDPFITFVMIYLMVSTKSAVAIVFVGLCITLWFTSKADKPFHTWKPSVIKSFLKNWNEK